jgi:hypothetical protein
MTFCEKTHVHECVLGRRNSRIFVSTTHVSRAWLYDHFGDRPVQLLSLVALALLNTGPDHRFNFFEKYGKLPEEFYSCNQTGEFVQMAKARYTHAMKE